MGYYSWLTLSMSELGAPPDILVFFLKADAFDQLYFFAMALWAGCRVDDEFRVMPEACGCLCCWCWGVGRKRFSEEPEWLLWWFMRIVGSYSCEEECFICRFR